MRAGALGADVRGADLVDVRWGGLEVAAAIQVTVRDEDWGTVAAAARDVEVEEHGDAFSVAFDAVHAGGTFAWRCVAQGRADGTLDVAVEGEALRDFVYRRIGLCVLHPWSDYVGARFRASGPAGDVSGVFPEAIAPQPFEHDEYRPMIPAFHRLAVAFGGGVEATFALEGEEHGFELEDQRNWTDATFKTYPTPLSRSAPRTIRAGERLRQRLRLGIAGAPPSATDEGPVTIRIGACGDRRMPAIGVTAPPAGTGSGPWAELAALGPAHVRVATDPGDPSPLRAAALGARRADLPLEVAVLLDDDAAGPGLGALGAALGDAPLARVMLLHRGGRTADGELLTRLGPQLGLDGVPLVGGTASHFSELNRSAPGPRGLDGVALAMTPQVHSTDARSAVASLEIQAQIVERLRALVPGRDVVVSPVTLAAHDPSTPDDRVDDRVGSGFGIAWTAGSVAALASAGVAAITLHERADRTVLASDDLARLVGRLAGLRGRRLHEVRASHPRCVTALAVEGAPWVLVNLTPDAVDLTLEEDAGRRTVALGPYEVAELDRSPR